MTTNNGIEFYFNNLVESLEKKIADKKTARRILVRETGRIGQKLFNKEYASAWTGVFVPFEILHSMDVGAVFIEFIGAMLASTGRSGAFLRKAEEYGYSADGCAYHRSLVGAALNGILGKPQLLIGATTPCDGGLKTILNLGENIGVIPYVIDIPYPPLTSEKLNYLVKQYKGMIKYVTELTGKKFDPERLRESVRYSNQATAIVKDTYDLCKSVPAPITSETLKNFQIIFSLLMGGPESIEVANAFLAETRAHIENGCKDLPREDFRLLWIQNRVQFKNNLTGYLQEKFNAKVVIDELNYVYWNEIDEDDPLTGLAERQIMHPLNGPIEPRVKLLKKMCEEYKVDGAINPAHWGCRQNCGVRQLLKDNLRDAGVPVINLDVDCIDSRNYSEGQLLTRLQSFMEMLG